MKHSEKNTLELEFREKKKSNFRFVRFNLAHIPPAAMQEENLIPDIAAIHKEAAG